MAYKHKKLGYLGMDFITIQKLIKTGAILSQGPFSCNVELFCQLVSTLLACVRVNLTPLLAGLHSKRKTLANMYFRLILVRMRPW